MRMDRLKRLVDPAVIGLAARYVGHAISINLNHSCGNAFIPRGENGLRIETSSRCNLKCRFCAYEYKTSSRVTMSDAFFRDCVRQGVDMGFRTVDLTPCTGDVFMDRQVFKKLEFLEDEPGIQGFYFFTNFTIPDTREVERLIRFKKFQGMSISLYGHDLTTFKAITKSTDKVYHRLVSNLNTLSQRMDDRTFSLELSVKSVRRVPRIPVSELMRAVERFRRAGIDVSISNGLYNNWGGMVTEDHLVGLDMKLKGSDYTYKRGACQRLFSTVQIMATGIVNGCACRDAEATLRIGDMREQPLSEILSSRNEAYIRLIDEQERGEFQPICHGCDFYRSIYLPTSTKKKNRFSSVAAFKASMDRGPAKIAPPPTVPASDESLTQVH
jgi:sulfatase maturation enzyme AslB (radical SAM superfamily)